MYLRFEDGYADGELHLLGEHLDCLDRVLSATTHKISASRDPDGEGLLDTGEYFVGAGFAAIQRYVSATYPYLQVEKSDALAIPPSAADGVSVVQAINAGANYWKHLDEWGLRTIVERDVDKLTRVARQTIETIASLTPWADYTCSNLLAALTGAADCALSGLIPLVTEWRDNLDARFGRARDQPNQEIHGTQ